MCPLRIILIFLSATVAGFFVIRNLNSSPNPQKDDVKDEIEINNALPFSTKASVAVQKCFWTFVDMASGRYLWKNLISSSSSSSLSSSTDKDHHAE